ncbi:unnamed protein product [Candidula unifasciata]|uniref:Methyltransferase FkbM domain-containing protein n=1 Tax=Candidula unifasciata TaxID=100452 RepID=A0A8S3YNX4_9EUPU|nr:unnamed protein product [Candidula unifasciata]
MSRHLKCIQPVKKTLYKVLFYMILTSCIYITISFLPKPKIICGVDNYRIRDVVVSDRQSSADNNSLEKRKAMTVGQDVIDTARSKTRHMFSVYSQRKHPVLSEFGSAEFSPKNLIGNSLVRKFHLQNCNFSHFGRAWVNSIVDAASCMEGSHLRFKTLKQYQKLPDCVRLKVPHDALPTKICVHYPSDDNFISNRLRDTGIWEQELVSQMGEFFQNNPDSQLVDLGCNIGVFTLFAASISKPVLAVDILPSNLALIQLSIALNDDILEQVNSSDENTRVLHQSGHNKETPPKYSDLITTVHNAVYCRHAKMYVYLKDDLNLGGTEVKEINIKNDNLLNTLQRITKAGKQNHSRSGLQADSQIEDVTKSNATILVDAICLDDLVPYVRTNLSVFLKMDIEGSEPDVFKCARNFFMHVDVRVILMEIAFHKYSDHGKTMMTFLLQHNMVPSEDAAGRKLLNTDFSSLYNWPDNVFWVKVR